MSDKFIDFSTYNANQAILTSDRLIFNAREDNLFLLAKKDIAMSMGGDMHINVGPKGSKTSLAIVNAGRVQFGLNKDTMEPVAKGDSLVASINSILTELLVFLNALTTAKGLVAGGVAGLPTINKAAVTLFNKIPEIQKNLSKIKSTVTFSN